MDSVTQMALGASVGEMVLGRRIGNKALIIGAVVGSLPDLDVLVPFGGAVEDFTYHRSFSHSLIVLTAVAPLLAGLLSRVFAGSDVSFKAWWLMTWLALVTHPLLDGFTVYGTQLLWPLTDYPVSGSSVFIIDPVYTLLLLMGLFLAFRRQPGGHRWNTVFLCLAGGYLLWSQVAKYHVESKVKQSLEAQSIEFDRLLTTPMPFNTLGWRFVAMQNSGYLTGFYSLLDPPAREVVAVHHDSAEHLLSGLQHHWPVPRLQYFTHGFYAVSQHNNDVLISDLRMGVESAYIFSFIVAEVTDDGVVAVPNREAEVERDFSRMPTLMRRIYDPDVNPHRAAGQ